MAVIHDTENPASESTGGRPGEPRCLGIAELSTSSLSSDLVMLEEGLVRCS